MSPRRAARRGALGLALLMLAGLAACSPLVAGSEARVAVAAPFTSYNAETSHGRSSTTNSDVASLTGTGFGYTAPDGGLVLDESFGTAEIVQREPLIVRYTVAAGLRWSDGAPLDAVDLLLAWAAGSGALNTPGFDDAPYVDGATGRYTDDFPAGAVWFDGRRAGGIEAAVSTPQLVDGRTLLVRFERFVPSWRTVLAPGVPAHLLGALAAGADGPADPGAARRAVAEAILAGDAAALAPLSRAWNSALDLVAPAGAEGEVPASGPYRVASVDEDGGVELVVNPRYTGRRAAVTETLRLVVSPDPLETAELLADGVLDVASPPPSENLVAALHRIPGVAVTPGLSARVEHLDLRLSGGRSGALADPRVREAFLLTVPREEIVERLIRPLSPDARVLDSFTVRESAAAYADAIAGNGSSRFAAVDLDRARALLAQAGAGRPELCILYDSGDPRRRAEFELIAASAGRAGFRVDDCSRPDWESMLGVAGAYDAALFSWDTSRLGPEAMGRVFHSASAVVNLNGFADPAADAIVEQLETEDDPGRQQELLAGLDAILWQAGYGLPLFTHPTVTAVRGGSVAGVSRSPLERGVLWNAWEWRPAQE